MSDNPYINKQDWGMDLLARLNNLLTENGSLNHWTELPLLGPNGNPLGPEHNGLTGLLLGKETEIVVWNGTEWDSLLRIPIEVSGDPVSSAFISDESFEARILDPHLEYPSFFISQTNNTTNTFTLKKYSKISGELEWQSSAAVRAGHNFIRVFNTRRGAEGFDIDSNNIYVGLLEFVSISTPENGYLSVVAFRLTDGAFLWRSELGAAISSSYYPISVKSDGSSVYLSQRFTNNIIKLNASSGAIQATHAYTQLVTNTEANLFLDAANDKVVFWTRNSSSGTDLIVYSLPTDLSSSSLIKNYGDAGVDQGIAKTNQVLSLPNTPHLFYFLQGNKIWQFNYLTNTTNLYADDPEISFTNVLGIRPDGENLLILGIQGTLIKKIIVSPTSSVIDSELITPYGAGTIEVNRQPNISSPIGFQFYLRSQFSQKGLIDERTELQEIFSSRGGQRILSLLNSILTNSRDTNLLRSNVNYDELYCRNLTTEKINSSKYIAPGSTPATSSSSPVIPDCGLSIGANLAGFALNGTNSFSAESKGYSGGGSFIGGIGWGCEPTKGRIVQRRSNSLFAGISLFDLTLGKFFVQVAPAQTFDSVIASFPNGSGLTFTGDNFLGIKTQSPAYPLDVVGTARATTLMNSGGAVTSDERIKVGILPLDGLSLWEICEELVAISFLYQPDVSFEVEETTTDENGNQVSLKTTQKWPLPQGIQYGWSAQEIQKQFPELVSEDPQSGILYLNREALFPIFQSAATAKIKQLEGTVAQKDAILTQLQSALESLTARVEALENAAA